MIGKKKEKIGEFLVRKNFITLEQVDDVMDIQKLNPEKKFGTIALESGYINDEAMSEYIKYYFDAIEQLSDNNH